MANLTNVSIPVRDRSGNIVGTDVLLTSTAPLNPATISAGCVRVTCSCGRIYDNVPQAKWDSWPAIPKGLNGTCGCAAHFA